MADTARTDKPVVYLSGPMTGYEDWNFPAFNKAAAGLRAWGFAVINPAENIGGEANMTAEWFLGLDLTMIVTRADMIVLLDGWEDSYGSKVEVYAGDAVGLPVYKYDPNQYLSLGAQLHGLDFDVDYREGPADIRFHELEERVA